jgi:hypothetical protein
VSERTWKLLAYAAVVIATSGVFALYTRPQMMVTLGDFIWACFN